MFVLHLIGFSTPNSPPSPSLAVLTWSLNLVPQVGPSSWSLKLVPHVGLQLGPSTWFSSSHIAVEICPSHRVNLLCLLNSESLEKLTLQIYSDRVKVDFDKVNLL